MYFSHCDRILTESLWGEIERTMSDVIAYPGVQEWWKTRRHWHTKSLAASSTRLSPEATSPRLTQPRIYARSSSRRKRMNDLTELDNFAQRYAKDGLNSRVERPLRQQPSDERQLKQGVDG